MKEGDGRMERGMRNGDRQIEGEEVLIFKPLNVHVYMYVYKMWQILID